LGQSLASDALVRNHFYEDRVCMAPARLKILIIEDDERLSEALVAGLQYGGYDVITAAAEEEGFFLVHSARPDLLLLDQRLSYRSELNILRQIRSEGIDLRVLILTSHNTIADRVEGLCAGADDYLGKPFSFPELLARIDALLRKVPPTQPAVLTVADLTLDTRARTATRSDERLELTTREFGLLTYLVENRGRTVSCEMLARDVWRETSCYTLIDDVIDAQVTRLRRKIDDPFEVKLLQTIRGLGFCLREP